MPNSSDWLAAVQARAEQATQGPWNLWEGPLFVGGGANLCIWAGKKWLANMVTSSPTWPYRWAKEQRANAIFIAHAREDVPRLIAALTACTHALEMAKHHPDVPLAVKAVITDTLSSLPGAPLQENQK